MPTIRTDDIETFYERRGDGPPVVFVHGAIVDHSQWEPQLEALSDEYTTLGYDVRATGGPGVRSEIRTLSNCSPTTSMREFLAHRSD